MEERVKRVCDSRTEQIQIVLPSHANGKYRLFGGQLAQWIDIVAGVAARRHSDCNVVTASIDSLNFQKPAFVNDTIVLIGCVTYVGRASMEVRVDTYSERLGGGKSRINRAYLTMVALDEENKPTPVPRLSLETDEERAEWEAGKRRSELRKQRKEENF